jgi:acetyltransferase-like isoleucine patch superfamily enzyme
VLFSHRGAEISDGVYIGDYALLGHVRIGQDSLIGSRTSLMSGGQQHRLTAEGKWSATDSAALTTITVGNDVWIGEGAIIMADVGERSMVSAGAVVAAPIKAGIMVAGNPARFVRRLELPAPAEVVKTADRVAEGQA